MIILGCMGRPADKGRSPGFVGWRGMGLSAGGVAWLERDRQDEWDTWQ